MSPSIASMIAALQDVAQHRLHENRTMVVVCEEVDRTAHWAVRARDHAKLWDRLQLRRASL